MFLRKKKLATVNFNHVLKKLKKLAMSKTFKYKGIAQLT